MTGVATTTPGLDAALRCRSRTRAAVARAGALLVACVVGAAAIGCGSSARRGLQPRVADESLLRQEAAQTASPEPLYQLALFYLSQDRSDDAVLALQDALSRNEFYEPALTLLAKVLHDAGRGFEALGYFERRAVEEWPASVQINIALLLAEVGNTIEARRILESHVAGPWAVSARANLAYLDLLDEEAMAARQQLEELIEDNLHEPEALNNLAVARLRQGDVEGSVTVLQRLTAHHEEFAVAHINLSLLLQHWLFDETGAARVQAHLDGLLEPRISDAVIQRLLDPTQPEYTAPPVPEAPTTEAQP